MRATLSIDNEPGTPCSQFGEKDLVVNDPQEPVSSQGGLIPQL